MYAISAGVTGKAAEGERAQQSDVCINEDGSCHCTHLSGQVYESDRGLR